MKWLNKYYLLIAPFIFSSCYEVLDTPPQATVSSSNFWLSEGNAQSALTATYAVMLDEYYYGHNEHIWDCISDDVFCAGDWNDDAQIEILEVKADNGDISALWKNKYEAIARANDVIYNVPLMSSSIISETSKKHILGQAYFLRAWNYYRLAIVHGGVPIIEENTNFNSFNKARATLVETYAFIEKDLVKSAELLSDVKTWDDANLGRINWGSAMGMLSKVYLYEKKWPEAEAASQKVLNEPSYKLATNYSDNFKSTTRNNPEVLFALQFSPNSQGGGGSIMSLYFYPHEFGGWNFFHPEQGLVNAFENLDGSAVRPFSFDKASSKFIYDDNKATVDMQQVYAQSDPRLKATIISVGETYTLSGTAYKFPAENTMTGYCCHKYIDDQIPQYNNSTFPILRLSEIFLIHAEALIRQAKSGDADINAVRTRVGLSSKSNCTLDDVLHERRCELGTEGNRWFDLVRFGKAKEVLTTSGYLSPIGKVNFVEGKSEVMPIPQSEIDLSQGVLLQNSNY